MLCGVLLLAFLTTSSTALAQAPRTPTETIREFYKMMREKKFREAFGMSIYRPALEGLTAQEFEDLRPDFERVAIAITEKIPEKMDFTGEQISGDSATVFVKVLDAEGKEKIEPATLIKIDNVWIVGDRENLALFKKRGKSSSSKPASMPTTTTSRTC